MQTVEKPKKTARANPYIALEKPSQKCWYYENGEKKKLHHVYLQALVSAFKDTSKTPVPHLATVGCYNLLLGLEGPEQARCKKGRDGGRPGFTILVGEEQWEEEQPPPPKKPRQVRSRPKQQGGEAAKLAVCLLETFPGWFQRPFVVFRFFGRFP